jgi:formylglycine-generating enzyme required for sulfatase activity
MDWRDACSVNGAEPFPYGTRLDTTACNIGWDRDDCTNYLGGNCGVVEVPSPLRDCKSFNGASDMVGNVAEWTTNCELELAETQTPASQTCSANGGSFADKATLSCHSQDFHARSTQDVGVGFRCCAQAD